MFQLPVRWPFLSNIDGKNNEQIPVVHLKHCYQIPPVTNAGTFYHFNSVSFKNQVSLSEIFLDWLGFFFFFLVKLVHHLYLTLNTFDGSLV